MELRFSKPFDEIAGTDSFQLEILRPIKVRDLLKRAETEIPALKPYVKKEGDEVQNFFAVLVKDGEILKLDDVIINEDMVRVFPPLSGG